METIFGNNDIFEKSSKILKKAIDKILLQKDIAIIGLPGGRSISKIIESLKKEDIDWSRVHVFIVDERMVSIDHPDSNFRLINEGLSDVIPTDNFHPFIIDEEQTDFGLGKYQREIHKYGESYDIVVVSGGEDGHIGSLYPNHDSILDESEYLVLVHDSPKPPSFRMSISRRFFLKSKIGFLFFIGESKKDAYSNFLDEDIDYMMCPSKLINELPESYLITNIQK